MGEGGRGWVDQPRDALTLGVMGIFANTHGGLLRDHPLSWALWNSRYLFQVLTRPSAMIFFWGMGRRGNVVGPWVARGVIGHPVGLCNL